ncbi:MAG: protease inhibitor I42 family protein [Gammaproteobacteria bacterium]|nr:protease inhibitor I42 family protein [Gammaproteobacteria bacterium]
MKKIFIPIIILAVLSLGVGYAMVAQTLSSNNPVYTLQLKSNPTTGYSWFIMNYDHDLLQLKSHRYVGSSNKNLVGAGGYEIFEFQATPQALTGPHTTAVKMIYARPWELKNGQIPQGSQVKTFTINIRS